MDLGCRQKHMNTPSFARRLDSLTSGINVLVHATGESSDDRAFDLLGDFLNRREITVTDHREPGLDHIHLEPCQLTCHFEFLT